MFGAKGPNSSQYDFKGTSVLFSSFRLSLLLHLTNLLRHVQAEQAEVHQEDLNPIKAVVFPTNYKTKPTNFREQNTGMH